MEKTTAELTNEYIKEHPDIKSCLKKDLINYSSLSRLIGKELNIEKKTSMEAILIAARRFQDRLKKEQSFEKRIKDLLARSELEIKNKIVVFIVEKDIDFDLILDIQKAVRKEFGTLYLLEGSGSYTIITQERFGMLINAKFKNKIIKMNRDLSLLILKSSKDIEQVVGVVSFLASLFSENGVNIKEFFSCWTDTLFVIDSNDLNKAIGFLKF